MRRATATGIPLRHDPHVARNGGVSSGIGRGVKGFWTKIDVSGGPAACWPWTGYIDDEGYGKFCTAVAGMPRTVRPHRHAYEIQCGPIPADKYLLHSCDNRRCCNPAHLRPGTQAENIRECYAKGRHENKADNRGELGGRAILTEENVHEIIAYRGQYGAIPLLARLHGVSQSCIQGVIYGRSWKHVNRHGPKPAMPLRLLRELVEQRERDRRPPEAA